MQKGGKLKSFFLQRWRSKVYPTHKKATHDSAVLEATLGNLHEIVAFAEPCRRKRSGFYFSRRHKLIWTNETITTVSLKCTVVGAKDERKRVLQN